MLEYLNKIQFTMLLKTHDDSQHEIKVTNCKYKIQLCIA